MKIKSKVDPKTQLEFDKIYLDQIIGKLNAENGTDLSDETFERSLGPCICGPFLVRAAKNLRDNDILVILSDSQ